MISVKNNMYNKFMRFSLHTAFLMQILLNQRILHLVKSGEKQNYFDRMAKTYVKVHIIFPQPDNMKNNESTTFLTSTLSRIKFSLYLLLNTKFNATNRTQWLTLLQIEHLPQFLFNISLDKGVHNRIHCRVGDQSKIDHLPQDTSKRTHLGQETNAPVVSSQVSDVESRDDQEYHDGCTFFICTLLCRWRGRDVHFSRGVVETNLGDQIPRFASTFAGQVKQMACNADKG